MLLLACVPVVRFGFRLDDAEAHVFDCAFKPVTCNRCLKLVAEAEIKLHNDVCTHMKILCPQCNEVRTRAFLPVAPAVASAMYERLIQRGQLGVALLGLRGQSVRRAHLDEHVRNFCIETAVDCLNQCGERPSRRLLHTYVFHRRSNNPTNSALNATRCSHLREQCPVQKLPCPYKCGDYWQR